MKIKILFIFSLCLTPLIGFSQEKNIADWQRVHPNVIFIESNDFTEDFEEKLISLKQEFIVYSSEISINDINRYESKSNEKSTANQLRTDGGNQVIKDWLGQNPAIKIISRSDFESASEEKQATLLNNNVLVLIGEQLTQTDIENYETTR